MQNETMFGSCLREQRWGQRASILFICNYVGCSVMLLVLMKKSVCPETQNMLNMACPVFSFMTTRCSSFCIYEEVIGKGKGNGIHGLSRKVSN